MDSKGKYNTRQKELILKCLLEHKDEHVTADKIFGCLKSQGASVGQTTVYRNLDKLVKEGSVVKYAGNEGMGACYQFVSHDQCCTTHYHLVCAKCGQVIHLKCDYLDEMTAHLLDHHQFSMDKFKTVIYGVCRQCEAAKQPENERET